MQRPACVGVRRERVGLPPGAVEREDELAPQPLAEWVRPHELFELRHELRLASEGELGVDPVLDDAQAKLLEPCDLRLGERLVRELRQGRAAPEGERRTEAIGGRGGVAVGEPPPPLLDECGELVDVAGTGGDAEDVAGPCVTSGWSPFVSRTRRSADTEFWTILPADGGALPFDSSSTIRSLDTTSFACTSSSARSARARPGGSETGRAVLVTSTGPRRRYSIAVPPFASDASTARRHGLEAGLPRRGTRVCGG